MNIKVIGFRRPFAISVSSEKYIVCLTKAPQKKIYIFLPNKEVISTDVSQLGVGGAVFLAINDKNEIIILDEVASTLNWFDFQLNKLSSIKLPGSSYGAMKFEKNTNQLYVSVLDLFVVLQIDSDGSSILNLLDYSNIDGCDNVNGLAKINDRLILIDTEQASLFDISLSEGSFEYTKHLEYGRGGEGKVRNPTDINVLNDFIVVHDCHNYFTQFFDKNLKFIYQLGGKGQANNKFDLPVSGCAVNDELYVCDQNNDRIVLLNSISKDFNVIAEDKFIEGYLKRPSGIAIDSDKNIYIADRSNGVIQKFDSNLNFLEILSLENAQLNRPSSISVFENNNNKYIVIIERKSGSNSSLNIYMLSDDEKTLIFYSRFDSEVSLNDPQDMVASKSGYVYVADTLNRRIIQVDLNGKLVNQVDMTKISGNKRILIKTIFVQDGGDVFTADFDECIVYRFDSEFRLKNKIDFSGIRNNIHVLRGIYAAKDYLLLCVRGENEVLMSDYQGVILREVDCKKQTGLDWNHPVKFCATENGEILIADKENDRVIMFDNKMDSIIHTTKEYN